MEKPSLHIIIVNRYATRGGIPKFVATLANNLSKRGHKVTIYSQKAISPLLYPLYKIGYKIHCLSLRKNERPSPPRGCENIDILYPLEKNIDLKFYKITHNNKALQKLGKELLALNPDVCLCPFADSNHFLWALTLRGTGIPFLYSEHHSPHTIESQFTARLVRLAAMVAADSIHLLLPSYKHSVPEYLQERVQCIPNPIDIPKKHANTQNNTQNTLVWLARFDDSLKQWRMAIDAFALIAKKYPHWKMCVYGHGQEEAHVKKAIAEHKKNYHLGDQLQFSGESKDPYKTLTQAQAYCFSSKTEGLPISLLEAMASGLPCVAFKDCDGVTDIIQNEVNGILVNSMSTLDLSKALERIFTDDKLREQLGKNARISAEKFASNNIFDAWERLIQKTALAKNKTVLDSLYQEPFISKANLVAYSRKEWLWRNYYQSIAFHAFCQNCKKIYDSILSKIK